jgi:tetraacyldisaccharide 4'-kinase
MEPLLRRWWAGELGVAGDALSVIALAPEALYRSAVRTRATAYASGVLRVERASIPVVSVGNLSTGGTGKTPITGWIVERLQRMGENPAVLLRGYGDDEQELHLRWNPQARVIANRDRVRAAREAASHGATVAVLDDGFQHRRLARDLDIVLVSAEQPFPARLLPRGPFREDGRALERAHLIVLTRRTADDGRVADQRTHIERAAGAVPLAVVRLGPDRWTDLAGWPSTEPRGPILAVAGVAEPEAFGRMVEAATGWDTELLAFPDHHAYDLNDVRRIRSLANGRTIVLTEKDAVKLKALDADAPEMRVMTMRVEVEQGAETIDAALARVTEARVARAGNEDRQARVQRR